MKVTEDVIVVEQALPTAMPMDTKVRTPTELAPLSQTPLLGLEQQMLGTTKATPVNLALEEEVEMELEGSDVVHPTPKPTPSDEEESENENMNDDSAFVAASSATHRGKMNLKKKEDEKKAAAEKSAKEQKAQVEAADDESKDSDKAKQPETQLQAKQMVFCMAEYELKCEKIHALPKHARSRIPKKSDSEAAKESGDDKDEVMKE